MVGETIPPSARANARRLRKAMTDAERRLWNQLRAHRMMGLGFRRQVPIGPYIVDFACSEHRLIVEIDGSQHARHEQALDDARRTAVLGNSGWRVIRFWNDDVLRDLEGVCDHIVKSIEEVSPDAFR